MTTADRRLAAPHRRTVRRRADQAVTRLLHLPPPSTAYTVDRGLRVPMRDGVQLVADHYAPGTERPVGTVLVRSPYGRGWSMSLLSARVYASRGYHVVVESVRGTFGSGGDFTPMAHEAADGADTVAWLRTQPWFTGGFATASNINNILTIACLLAVATFGQAFAALARLYQWMVA